MKNKIKTRKTVSRRFKITATGKIMHEKTGQNHLMRKKDGARKRNLTAGTELYPGVRKRVTRMLGGGHSTGGSTPRNPVVETAEVTEAGE